MWTGSELLVWGGVQEDEQQKPAGDGAAYDPATRSWTAMPASPLSPRDGVFGVWTGYGALFWGGGDGSPAPLMDGAIYDPAGRTWSAMATCPLSADADGRQAIAWTGKQMIVIQPAGGAAFDPATNAWTSVPPLPSVSGWQPYEIEARWTGGAIVAWVAARPTVVNGVIAGGYRFNAYWWAPGTGAWNSGSGELAPTDQSRQKDDGFPFGTGVIVGGRLLFLGGNDCPPGTACPAEDFFDGAWFDPTSGTWTYLPATFSGGAGPAVWTGSAMVVFATRDGAGGTSDTLPIRASDTVPAEESAAFDPRTGEWTDLAPCPLADLNAASLAWTGRELVVVAMNGDTGKSPQADVLSE